MRVARMEFRSPLGITRIGGRDEREMFVSPETKAFRQRGERRKRQLAEQVRSRMLGRIDLRNSVRSVQRRSRVQAVPDEHRAG